MHTKGQLQAHIPLARYTSWRVGGPARRLYRPANIPDLCHFLRRLPPQESLLWLGLGSNTLIRDGGFPGTVIITQGSLSKIEATGEATLRVEAGVACPTLARHTARAALTGAEFLAGIPGTVGGALAMNAGCHGGEIWQLVTRVETVDRRGEIRQRTLDDYRIGYRSVQRISDDASPDEWFLAAHLQLIPGDKTTSLETIRQLLARRAATQPINQPSGGSVFRNPEGDYAARLIEACGLKGRQIGGAQVSPKHANFIVNSGAATAADIEALIDEVAETVLNTHQVRLQREVHIRGLPLKL